MVSTTSNSKITLVDTCNKFITSAKDCVKKAKKVLTASNNPPVQTKPLTPIQPRKPRISQLKRTDRRVFLNVRPLSPSTQSSDFLDRVAYVLGSQTANLNGSNIYGYLYGCLQGTVGMVFPYTPQIDFSHSANYETTDIFHSNLSVAHYKNTPAPEINISAVFTADCKEMARHMLAAIWFLRAATKCDFGEQSISTNEGNERGTAGLPPPILYLNGWNNMIDNIPVVITNFRYTLPDNKEYVKLGLNLDSRTFEYQTELDVNGDYGVYNSDNPNQPNLKSVYKSGITFVNGQPLNDGNIAAQNSLTSATMGTNNKNAFYLLEWLPTELKVSITLKVQYNLLKYKKAFDLNKYKMGVLYLENQKTGSDLYAVNNGCIQPVLETTTNTSIFIDNIQENGLYRETGTKKFNYGNNLSEIGRIVAGREVPVSYTEQTPISPSVGGFALDETTKYTFDNSGWTW